MTEKMKQGEAAKVMWEQAHQFQKQVWVQTMKEGPDEECRKKTANVQIMRNSEKQNETQGETRSKQGETEGVKKGSGFESLKGGSGEKRTEEKRLRDDKR